MDFLLIDTDGAVTQAFLTAFGGIETVQIENDRFEPHIGSFDCLVSPANSFGLMSGGIDGAITAFFGDALEDRVQDEIWRVYRGEQPVGSCLVVPTEDARCPWLAHCPTMRTPLDVA